MAEWGLAGLTASGSGTLILQMAGQSWVERDRGICALGLVWGALWFRFCCLGEGLWVPPQRPRTRETVLGGGVA